MSAVPSNTRKATQLDSRLQAFEHPFCTLSAVELLRHFSHRPHVRYFSVIDEEQSSAEKLSGVLQNRFCFNNESYQLDEEFDWTNNPSTDVEWLILLHKFYYAVGLGRAFEEENDPKYFDKWVALTRQWIESVPVDFLSSDVTGRRVQNWIFAYRYFMAADGKHRMDPEFHLDFLVSIRQQVCYLCKNLTPARNHRTLELYAIFLAAVVFPELKDAGQWLDFAITELHKNLCEDFLADGVHCELSTDYHHIVLRNMLGVKRLASLNEITLPEDLDRIITQALVFSVFVHKPDGYIPAISDGDAVDFRELLRQGYELYQDQTFLYVATSGQKGTPPPQRSKIFTDSGYCILRSDWGKGRHYPDERYLFFDCGPLGAGNHGHLDLLNIEVAAYGRSLIVDPGRFTYDESGEINWRVLFRGTGYHNTVQVDGKNQTRYAPHIRKFKIQGPEPARELRAALTLPGFDYLHGIAISHEYPVIHERKILFIDGAYWLICDVLRAEEKHGYELRFHLDPLADQQTKLEAFDDMLLVSSPNLVMMQSRHAEVSGALESGFVSPTYGIKQAAPVVNFTQQAANACFYTLIVPFKNQKPNLSVQWLNAHCQGNPVPYETAAFLRIDWIDADCSKRDEIFVSHASGMRLTHSDMTTSSPFWIRRTNKLGGVVFNYDMDSVRVKGKSLL